MKKLLLLLFLPFAALAQKEEKEFKIKGQLHLVQPVDWVYLSYVSSGQRVVDSFQARNGAFEFSGRVAEPMLAQLTVKYQQQAGEAKARRESLPIFLEPTVMNIIARDSLKINSVSGAAAHVDFVNLNKQLEPYGPRLNALYEEYARQNKMGDKAGMEKVESAIIELNQERDEIYAAFIRSNSQSPVALYALKQYAGWEINPEKVAPLFESLSAEVKQLPSGVALKELVEIAQKTAVGQMAMDFTQNDTLGRPVSLSSFRGKYVLVDFWASWCGPCRRENPNLVKAFNAYKDRNFTILGVSLDRPDAKEKWMAAIRKDGLTWTQLSDLKYWDNEVAKQYGIRAIPQNLLIGPDGRIIAKNIKGEALMQKLEEVLPK